MLVFSFWNEFGVVVLIEVMYFGFLIMVIFYGCYVDMILFLVGVLLNSVEELVDVVCRVDSFD